jgi:alkanesulfonate monooxygenase SsuD/methylene tetrahydromethanopterin reductase-like flavin-dependent oxidoreductase (luciferase family)
VARLEEALQILVPLLKEGHVDFAGRYYTVRDCELLPRGPRPNGPPIWLAAFGPRMLRAVARYADGFITAWHLTPQALAEPFAAVDSACGEVGRDPASMVRAIGTFVAFDEGDDRVAREGLRGSSEEVAESISRLVAMGASHVTIMLSRADAASVERCRGIVTALRQKHT